MSLAPSTRRLLAAQAYSLAGIATFIGIWAYAASRMEPYVLPPPWTVGKRMWELAASGAVLTNFADSLWRTVLGWAIAVVAGTVIGFLMGRFRYARAFFHDLIYLAANVPLIVYAIVAIIVFGISGMGPTSVVILFVLPGIALNVAAGMMSVDPDLVGMSQAFNRSRRPRRHVIIPTVMPFAFAAAGCRSPTRGSWQRWSKHSAVQAVWVVRSAVPITCSRCATCWRGCGSSSSSSCCSSDWCSSMPNTGCSGGGPTLRIAAGAGGGASKLRDGRAGRYLAAEKVGRR